MEIFSNLTFLHSFSYTMEGYLCAEKEKEKDLIIKIEEGDLKTSMQRKNYVNLPMNVYL